MFKIIPLGLFFFFFPKLNTNAINSFIRAILSSVWGEAVSQNSFKTGQPDIAASWHEHYNMSSHIDAAVH